MACHSRNPRWMQRRPSRESSRDSKARHSRQGIPSKTPTHRYRNHPKPMAELHEALWSGLSCHVRGMSGTFDSPAQIPPRVVVVILQMDTYLVTSSCHDLSTSGCHIRTWNQPGSSPWPAAIGDAAGTSRRQLQATGESRNLTHKFLHMSCGLDS